jgi:hypothetical protein
VIYQASIDGLLNAVRTVAICILLTLAEFLLVALLVAPKATARRLLALLRARVRPAQRIRGAPPMRRESARPSREGT